LEEAALALALCFFPAKCSSRPCAPAGNSAVQTKQKLSPCSFLIPLQLSRLWSSHLTRSRRRFARLQSGHAFVECASAKRFFSAMTRGLGPPRCSAGSLMVPFFSRIALKTHLSQSTKIVPCSSKHHSCRSNASSSRGSIRTQFSRTYLYWEPRPSMSFKETM
jgi:hypothetical protein